MRIDFMYNIQEHFITCQSGNYTIKELLIVISCTNPWAVFQAMKSNHRSSEKWDLFFEEVKYAACITDS